ncbi:MAG: DUF4345 domain-containing protein [Cyanobacteria bacterium P01_F01_bin.42]
MTVSNLSRVLLLFTGGIAVTIGGLVLYSPSDFYALSHIDFGGDVNLLNQVRASAGALFASGLVMLLGVFIPSLAFTSTVLATLIYLSYGLSRLAGIAIDGVPTSSLVWAAGIEVVLGVLGLLCLWREQWAPNSN